MSACPNYNDSSFNGWVYQEPRKNPKNGMNVYIKEGVHAGATNPRMQMDRSSCPFGVQDGMEEGARKNLELSVSSEGMRAWATALDNHNTDWITANCPALFKKEMPRSTVETLYRPVLTPASNPSYCPLIRVKINSGGRAATNVMIVVDEGDDSRPLRWKTGSIADLTQHCQVLPIVEVVGLWFVSKACGMTIVATDLLVFPQKKRGFDFSLGIGGAVQCNEEDGEDESALEPPESVFGAPASQSMVAAAAPSSVLSTEGNDDEMSVME
jgi:hypothetical protein